MKIMRIEFDPSACEFPEPYTDEWEGPFDVISCLHYAAVYEKWAEKAKASGRNDLTELYEDAAVYWFPEDDV